MLCLTSLCGDCVQEALDALRDAGHEQLPRGPAHVTLGEFTCASAEECLGRCQSSAWLGPLISWYHRTKVIKTCDNNSHFLDAI